MLGVGRGEIWGESGRRHQNSNKDQNILYEEKIFKMHSSKTAFIKAFYYSIKKKKSKGSNQQLSS